MTASQIELTRGHSGGRASPARPSGQDRLVAVTFAIVAGVWLALLLFVAGRPRAPHVA